MSINGRPRLFNSPEELQSKIDEYFNSGCTIEDVKVKNTELVIQVKRPTISGLSLYLGFADRHSFYDYEEYKEFSHTIKKARTRIEQHYEELLQKGLGAGAIFALKQFRWKDKTEVEHSGEIYFKKVDIKIIKHPEDIDVDVTNPSLSRI